MISQEIIDQVKQLIKQEMEENYSSGVPRIPPHQHDGVDNLQIEASNIIGLTTGGGSAAGLNGQIQFNDNGAFGADAGLTYDKTNQILGVHNIWSSTDVNNGFDLDIQSTFGAQTTIETSNQDDMGNPLDDTGPITIKSDDSASFNTGNITVQTGTAGTNKRAGSIAIQTGDGKTAGNINIKTGTYTNANQGTINIEACQDINIQADGKTSSNLFLFGKGSAQLDSGSTDIIGEDLVRVRTKNAGAPIEIVSSYVIGTDDSSGEVDIATGDVTGTGISGDINMETGAANISGGGSIGNILIKTPTQNATSTTGSIELNHANGGALIKMNGDGVNLGFITLDANIQVSIEPYRGGTVGNVLFFFSSGANTSNGNGTTYIGDSSNVPTITPSAGGVLYSTGGALHWLGSSGTDTTIAPA